MFGLQSNPLETFQKVWRSGPRHLKALAVTGLTLGVIGVFAAYVSFDYIFERVGSIFIGLAFLIWAYLETAIRAEQQAEIEAKIERAEQAIEEHPNRARPLWDLARSRLELYFERNLSQIRSIFFITVIVMGAGFLMIGYGIMQGFQSNNLNASVLAAAAGVLTEFIAATFLIIYRSTMSQASDYVRTLERINAVGMAIQIVDSISEDNVELKSKVRAELGTKILDVFGGEQHAPRAKKVAKTGR